MKKLIAIFLLIGNIFLITACNFSSERVEQNENELSVSNGAEQSKENFHGESAESEEITDTIVTDSWEHVTLDGITDEKAFLDGTTEEIRNIVSDNLQQLCDKIAKEEQNDPNFISEGKWFEYFVTSEEYQTVLELEESALNPLYFIIYKSENQGLYEYICSYAIYEISGLKDSDNDITWSTSKEFLDLFTEKIIEHRN